MNEWDELEYIDDIVEYIHSDLVIISQSGKLNPVGQDQLIKEIKEKVVQMVNYAYEFGITKGIHKEKYRALKKRQKQNYFTKRHLNKQVMKKIVSILEELENENKISKEVSGKILGCLD